ncbi:hypothetical protein ACJ41O_004884 [Fusarium nematophilum]
MDLTQRDEEARLLKLRLLTLRDENASLKDRLVQRDAHVEQLTKQSNDAHAELRETREQIKTQEMLVRKQDNELVALKTEIESLNDFMQGSNKVLQEKLALSHRLGQIQPEIDHLKAQLESHRAVVAQKQDLERQLSSLEVELENEKRSKQRTKSKSHDNDQWKEQLDETKRELEKVKKEHNRELREARGECDRMEGRLEDTKAKLKKTQADLKDMNAELEACRAELEANRKPSRVSSKTAKKTITMKDQPGRKRRANEMSFEDISIGTPGPDEASFKRPLKKRGAERALVGEKSTFSITPFLNRTKNMSDELSEMPSPTGGAAEATEDRVGRDDEEGEAAEPGSFESVEEAEEREEEPNETAVVTDVVTETKAHKARGRPRKALDDAPTTKKNMPASLKGKGRATKAASKLAMVVEEADPGEQENKTVRRTKKVMELKMKGIDSLSNPGNTSVSDPDARKKRRKILGGGASKPLFDEDDGEVIPRPAKIQLAPGRRLKAPLGGASNAFAGAAFSPLKRDKRGVGASFLA